jgi:bifunctional DNA-binding transcriptional regulator/antitoxin component of YhaV-PrlF toxin-antitoxin module
MSDTRIYPVDQWTLPEEVSSALQVKEGDFLEVSTSDDVVVLRPAQRAHAIPKFGTPEGEEEDRRAEQDFREGRYRTFEGIEPFIEYLKQIPGKEQTETVVGRLVTEALSETHGDIAAAAERLEQAKKALEARVLAGSPLSASK